MKILLNAIYSQEALEESITSIFNLQFDLDHDEFIKKYEDFEIPDYILKDDISMDGNEINFIHLLVKSLSCSEGFVAENVAELIRFLVRSGANPNLLNAHDRTPLHDVAKDSNLYILNALLDAGANPNINDEHGFSPLYYAFLCYGTDFEKLNENNLTSNHYGLVFRESAAHTMRRIDMAIALVKKGAIITEQMEQSFNVDPTFNKIFDQIKVFELQYRINKNTDELGDLKQQFGLFPCVKHSESSSKEVLIPKFN